MGLGLSPAQSPERAAGNSHHLFALLFEITCRPFRAFIYLMIFPMAHAMGYNLPPHSGLK